MLLLQKKIIGTTHTALKEVIVGANITKMLQIKRIHINLVQAFHYLLL